jgi:tetratricopeptide (TPR) repeat protein
MQNETENMGDKISDFVQKNRKGIFWLFFVIIFLFAGLIVYLFVTDSIHKKALAEVDVLEQRFNELSPGISLENETVSSDVEILLADIKVFAEKTSGFAGGKAWSIIAQIHSIKKEWPETEEAWLNAARTGKNTYLEPISYFNAAASAEEQGKVEEAVEFYEKCAVHKFDSLASTRAQFSIGRLYEKLNNIPAAIEAYRIVLIRWPQITVWVNLANSRIAVLEAL